MKKIKYKVGDWVHVPCQVVMINDGGVTWAIPWIAAQSSLIAKNGFKIGCLMLPSSDCETYQIKKGTKKDEVQCHDYSNQLNGSAELRIWKETNKVT